ncbi:hypothetical protein [Streptomyces sp. NPDC017993]|uniref:hypothetical protein n=1 Tax=Streptomyces sp. NPDC017993 TaxID=3365027 RepID=UPI00379A62C0
MPQIPFARAVFRPAAVAAVAIAAGVALTGCSGSLNPLDDHEERSEYGSGAAAKKDRASMPSWLPDDAKDIRYVLSTTGDDRLIAATFKDGRLPDGCTTGKGEGPGQGKGEGKAGAEDDPAKPQGKPKLKADWFPKDLRAKADTRCGTWSGAMAEGTFYAWQDDDVVQGWLKE